MALAESQILKRYDDVQARIIAAAGRPDHDVRIVAVTKAFDALTVEAVARCGIVDIGESYAQECVAKLAAVSLKPSLRVHFIGRLQRNKVKKLAACVDVWQSIDRAVIVDEIRRRVDEAGRRTENVDVMLQVNLTGAASQGGCEPSAVETLASRIDDSKLNLLGLMTIGPQRSSAESRHCFRQLRHMADELGLPHCSMGMSTDLEVAVEEGATMVRIGQSLLGARP